ncbi:MAG TPA: transglycosylase SLT domain-containing protein [Methylomirabilota bacterium]|nr:transglycosylase SLT domain-containing protein [Methylomirabilota bacterium]
MATTKRTFLTGSVAFLLTCLTLAGGATAQVDPALVNLALDPAAPDEVAAIPAVWSQPAEGGAASASRWSDVFGEPARLPAPRLASFTPPADPAPPIIAAARPSAAYRVHDNRHVRFFIDRFRTGYRRAVVESWLGRAGRYLPMILEVFRQKGLPDELAFTAMIESGFNPTAVSHAGAKGLWQFMAPTARLYGLRVDRWLDERLDPEKSTVAAANYLRDLYNQYGSWDLAQAAYNAGDLRVQQAIQSTGSRDFWRLHRSPLLLEETKNFVPAIHAATLIGRDPERYGFTVVPEEPLRYEQVTVPRGSRLVRLAALSGVKLQDFESLNPELQQKQTPPDSTWELKVPLGTADAVLAAVSMDAAPRKLAPAPREGVHVVKSGETLWRIAHQYGVSTGLLAKWNGLEKPDRIFPGERLRVAAAS